MRGPPALVYKAVGTLPQRLFAFCESRQGAPKGGALVCAHIGGVALVERRPRSHERAPIDAVWRSPRRESARRLALQPAGPEASRRGLLPPKTKGRVSGFACAERHGPSPCLPVGAMRAKGHGARRDEGTTSPCCSGVLLARAPLCSGGYSYHVTIEKLYDLSDKKETKKRNGAP